MMEFSEMVIQARELLFDRTNLSPQCSAGIVACSLETRSGHVYYGINIDTDCGMGFCAESSAISAMLKAGEAEIAKIVAVTKDRILPPCGRCREMIYQVNHSNLKTLVMVENDTVLTLEELLPYRWWKAED